MIPCGKGNGDEEWFELPYYCLSISTAIMMCDVVDAWCHAV